MRDPVFPKGRTRDAQSTEARDTAGAILNIIPVVLLKTLPFLNSTARSFMGWKIPGPLRPDAMLLVLSIIPGKNTAASNMESNPARIR